MSTMVDVSGIMSSQPSPLLAARRSRSGRPRNVYDRSTISGWVIAFHENTEKHNLQAVVRGACIACHTNNYYRWKVRQHIHAHLCCVFTFSPLNNQTLKCHSAVPQSSYQSPRFIENTKDFTVSPPARPQRRAKTAAIGPRPKTKT